ncbi:MAG: hypothetical protein V1850_05830 [Candidatus Bathyarchaeota archaeon]
MRSSQRRNLQGSNMNIMNTEKIHKLVRDMDEEIELAFLEEIVKKRIARLGKTEHPQ